MSVDKDQIQVDHFKGSAGGYGIMPNVWTVTYDGHDYRIVVAIDRNLSQTAQDEAIKEAAIREITAGTAKVIH